MLMIQLARYLDAIAMRQKLVETRSGTVMIMSLGRGQYAPQLIQAGPNLLDSGDEFDATQAPMIEAEASELVKVTSARGETFITKSDAGDEVREHHRKLALRLLRESLRHYSARGIDPRTMARVPSFRDLNWSSETWVKAVNILKPHVIAKQGRGGGTFCGEEYPTIVQLYAAIGERRITLSGAVTA